MDGMLRTLEHRGPDNRGWIVEGSVAVGMQRLSVIDIEGGTQPMQSACGRFVMVMNGEIFNFRELRDELVGQGVLLHTQSDTEVALEILANRGLDSVNSFNGMFAIALLDRLESKVHLIRDRFGVKPLYVGYGPESIVFASEVNAIFASGLVEQSIDDWGVWDYVTLRFVPTNRSIWVNIEKVPPSHFMTIELDTLQVSTTRYWKPPERPLRNLATVEQDDHEFARLLEDAVHLRLQADVPVGVALSGGLDSSAIAAIASSHTANMSTFAVGFEGDRESNELQFASQVSEYLGTSHTEISISRDEFFDFFPRFAGTLDEPMADLASIPFYFLCKRAVRQVKVLLSGEGADESLAGYDFDRVVSALEASKTKRRWGLVERSTKDRFARQYLEQPIVMTNQFSTAEKKSAFVSGSVFQDSLDYAREALLQVPHLDPLDQILHVYRQDWLVEDLLFRADRMSMANSLEVRTPFLDYRLVTWLARVPRNRKVGVERGQTVTKRLLRRYAKGRLPDFVTKRPKMGFAIPVYEWADEEFVEWAQGSLSAPSETRVTEILRRDFVDEVLRQGVSPTASPLERHRLWTLLTLEYWLRART
jgi:asparagine synthase (glutamine-hydrolysing)